MNRFKVGDKVIKVVHDPRSYVVDWDYLNKPVLTVLEVSKHGRAIVVHAGGWIQNSDWYVLEEIYNSPLAKVMSEEE